MNLHNLKWRIHPGVVANVLNYDILPNKFKLNSFYYVHLWINTLGISVKPLQLWVK